MTYQSEGVVTMFNVDFTRAFKELVEVMAMAMVGLFVVLVLYSLN